eukprot:TRINITY_DN15871_c0_g1_i1.p1 TRINITY_DN15871_c0_g1~~TRINITY_DN15871_c0_g1_i1.p1  ORF type:complete len:288 (+),score=40.26 TRINITY_DN15871_c0_g1_i1:34-897(+)
MLNKLWGSGPWFGSSRICRAAEADDLGTVKALATQSPQLVNQAGWMGWAPLHKAAQAGAAEVCQFLLAEKSLACDPNVFDSEKHTPLHLACGAPPESRKAGHKLVVASLLAHGANPNAEDDGGYTPLHLAVIQNFHDAVELLLSNGAQVNHMTADKFSPLHAAVRSQFGDIAGLLLKHGADFNLADGKGRTPLQIAQRVGMKLPIDDEVMRKQPAVVAATTPAGGMAPLPAHVPATLEARVRSGSSGSTASPTTMDPTQADKTSRLERVAEAGDDIQKEIEKELADS